MGKPVRGFGDADAVDLGRQAAHTVLNGPTPPTAIFAINDMFAFGVFAGARDLGLRVPNDLSVVGFDDIVLAEIMEPALTTVRQPHKKSRRRQSHTWSRN